MEEHKTNNTWNNTNQTIHRTTQIKQYIAQHKTIMEQHKTNNTWNNAKQTIHRTTQIKQYIEQHKTNNTQNTKILEEFRLCPILASYSLAFALQLRKEHRKTSVRVAEQ
jgi:hypothetical protein